MDSQAGRLLVGTMSKEVVGTGWIMAAESCAPALGKFKALMKREREA